LTCDASFEVAELAPTIGDHSVRRGQKHSELAARHHITFELEYQPPERRTVSHGHQGYVRTSASRCSKLHTGAGGRREAAIYEPRSNQ